MDSLIEKLSDINLEPEHLLFNPRDNVSLDPKALENIPRFLFRVASPKTKGETTETWVRSADALKKKSSSQEDIFSNLTAQRGSEISRSLNEHLRWWRKTGLDNFMSWTSSLLFALQYILYLHQADWDGSNLDEIKLYVMDTSQFPRGAFLRDLDLIDAFQGYENGSGNGLKSLNLKDFRQLRTTKGFYFGEYLSQGSMRVAGKCQVISADLLFEGGELHLVVRILQPEFGDIHSRRDGEPSWAKEVKRLRESIWPSAKPPPTKFRASKDQIAAVDEIAMLL
ncbi:hypothetical protein BO70DRAFT_131228 [Aspergillus heteromorphus CBS 117.55]|uniref:DUF7587 domain-containing protein n=1 Tax=Aspergillus heteromorphus CBS 117.55 TaxID=1448321 RepID=A0A317WU54_9EURO|nr:uncharacterized protein BO70DRAFT_131228 [Aspergillus heteromorphus CBS 117.55]PWY89953.1 hypothetical protein BO70DRAFT_131228 [Aspergillus heteromorphus CBS 117.55]